MQNNPLVSITIITYNRRNMLKKALDSIINQTYKNLEIIIADNHSEDDTEDLCKEYAQKDSRIKYFRHDKNIGMTNNANFIISKCTGDYIFSGCDDDWVDSDYLKKSIQFLSKHNDYIGTFPVTKLYDENYKLVKKCKKINLEHNNPIDRIQSYVENNLFCIVSTGLLRASFYKTLFDNEQIFFHDRYAEDWIVIIKALSIGKCKVIKNAYYNKLNNGYTKNIESAAAIWDIEGITYENFWDVLYSKIEDSINNDEFFKLNVEENKLETLKKQVKYAVANAEKKVYNPNKLSLKYLWRHPLFLFKPNFYRLLYNYIKGT